MVMNKEYISSFIREHFLELHNNTSAKIKFLAVFIPLLLWGIWWMMASVGYLFSETEWPDITPSVRAEIEAVKALPAFVDPASASAADREMLELQKGRVLALSIVARLQAEMDDGWTPQYLISPRAYFDNAVNRKLGVLMGTTLLQGFFSTHMAKYGNMDPENPWLQKARERDFTYSPSVWGFFERSSVSAYEDGVKNVYTYADRLVDPSAKNEEPRTIVNIKANEVYEMLAFILSKNFIDVPLGWLSEPSENVAWTDLDDRVYFAQGVTLVVRDVVIVLKELFPEKITNVDKGGTQNLAKSLAAMDAICVFNPDLVLRGQGDSMFADHQGKMARFMFTMRERLYDVSETIRR